MFWKNKKAFSEFVVYRRELFNKYESWFENEWLPQSSEAISIYESSPDKDLNKLKTIKEKFTQKQDFFEFYTHLKAWKYYLELISKQANEETAILVEQWIYRHVLSRQYREAMNAWWYVFVNTETIPDFLLPFRNEIYQIKREYAIEFGVAVDTAHEKYIAEQETRDDIYPEYINEIDLESALTDVRMNKVLRFLAEQLSSTQQKDLIAWAQEKYMSFESSSSYDMCGEELVTQKIPFSDFPTIIKIHDLKASIQFDSVTKVHLLPLI